MSVMPDRTKTWLIYGLSLPIFIVIIDQLTKLRATRFFKQPFSYCELYPYQKLNYDLTPIMDISLLCNQGISWGLLQGDSPIKRWALTLFAFVMSALLFWVLGQTKDKLSRLALGLVIGGAIGNAIDRFFFGAVTDFIDFSDIGFNYVFNIADSAITVGVIGLLIGSFLTKEDEQDNEKDETKTVK
jgi:signal peptidase II